MTVGAWVNLRDQTSGFGKSDGHGVNFPRRRHWPSCSGSEVIGHQILGAYEKGTDLNWDASDPSWEGSVTDDQAWRWCESVVCLGLAAFEQIDCGLF